MDIKQVMEGVQALRETVEKYSADSAEYKERMEKINKDLDAWEEYKLSQEKELKAQTEANEVLQKRIETLEISRAQSGDSKILLSDTDEYKAVQQYITYGDNAQYTPEQKATLRTDVDAQGGVLAPTVLDSEMVRYVEEVSNMRAICRVRTMSGKALQIAVRNGIPVAQWEGQAEEGPESNSTYENQTVTPYRLTFTTPVTLDQLQDSAFDMESEMFRDAAVAFAKAEGIGSVSGTGVKQPEGFLTNADILANLRPSSVSGGFNGDDLINLTGDLKEGYDPIYVFTRATLAYIRTLQDGAGAYMWQPGINGGVANTINGYPYMIVQDMPEVAANALAVAFGDWKRGYTIFDRTGMAVVRDQYSQKKKAIIEVTWHRWVGGKVIVPEAIKVMQCAA